MIEDTVKKNLDEVFDIDSVEDEDWQEPEVIRDLDGNPIGTWDAAEDRLVRYDEKIEEVEDEDESPEEECTDIEVYKKSELATEADNLDLRDIDKLSDEVLKNLGDLYKDLRYMLHDAITTAKATGHPQGYSAVASLSKTLLSVIGEKTAVRKKIEALYAKSKEKAEGKSPSNVTNITNNFNGTTADFLKQVLQAETAIEQEKKEVVVEAEIVEDAA